jgi:hypothetical protein
VQVRLQRWSGTEQMHASQMSIFTTRYTYMMLMTAQLRTLYFFATAFCVPVLLCHAL